MIVTEKTIDVLKTPTYKDKLYGRRWKVSVLVPKSKTTTTNNSPDSEYVEYVLSDSDYEDKSLRVTFNIQKKYGVSVNMSEISVYNLNVATENMLIENGYKVRVMAGYVNGDYGLICDTVVFQPIWEREDYVTTKLTLVCVDALHWVHDNWIISSVPKMKYQKDIVSEMAGRSRVAIPVKESSFTEGNANAKTCRGTVVCENAMDYIRRYCQLSGTLPTVIDNKISLGRMQDPLKPEAQKKMITVTAGKGGSLIGVPQQTQNGVDFTCLLNPNITVAEPRNLIKLDNTILRQVKAQYGVTVFANLDKDWTYQIAGVTHVGDTRGNEWYSHVTGINQHLEGKFPTYYGSTKDVTK